MPTNSGGGSTGAAILSPQQQQQQPGAAAAATAGLPTPTTAAVMPVPVPGLAGVSLKQEPNAAMGGASQVPGMPGAATAGMQQQQPAAAAAMAQATAGMQQLGAAAAAQQSSALPGAPLPRPPAAVSPVGAISGSEFRHVFDDVFDVHTATEPAATAAAAGRVADQEFLDFILKVSCTPDLRHHTCVSGWGGARRGVLPTVCCQHESPVRGQHLTRGRACMQRRFDARPTHMLQESRPGVLVICWRL